VLCALSRSALSNPMFHLQRARVPGDSHMQRPAGKNAGQRIPLATRMHTQTLNPGPDGPYLTQPICRSCTRQHALPCPPLTSTASISCRQEYGRQELTCLHWLTPTQWLHAGGPAGAAAPCFPWRDLYSPSTCGAYFLASCNRGRHEQGQQACRSGSAAR